MNLSGTLIRETRRSIGLSQTELAVASGLSLATIQNIEAGRANPSISTLRSAIEPLGLKVTVEPAESDWDALIALGLPLAGSERPSRGDPATLRRLIQCAALEVDRELPMPDRARKRECLVARRRAAP